MRDTRPRATVKGRGATASRQSGRHRTKANHAKTRKSNRNLIRRTGSNRTLIRRTEIESNPNSPGGKAVAKCATTHRTNRAHKETDAQWVTALFNRNRATRHVSPNRPRTVLNFDPEDHASRATMHGPRSRWHLSNARRNAHRTSTSATAHAALSLRRAHGGRAAPTALVGCQHCSSRILDLLDFCPTTAY